VRSAARACPILNDDGMVEGVLIEALEGAFRNRSKQVVLLYEPEIVVTNPNMVTADYFIAAGRCAYEATQSKYKNKNLARLIHSA
jgi:hypothetical protein